MQYICNFFSKRATPLVLQHLPEQNAPLITIENWEEWDEDSLYLVYHDGLVENILDDKFRNRQYHQVKETFQKAGDETFLGNIWNPKFIQAVADEFGYDIDRSSMDIIIGRWERCNYE